MKTEDIYGTDYQVLEVEDILNAERLPREVIIDDWPYGRDNVCRMRFTIEKDRTGKKERMVRQSTFNGRVNKPKKATYAARVYFINVEYNDRKYLGRVELSPNYFMASVYMEGKQFKNVTFHDEDFKTIVKHFTD